MQTQGTAGRVAVPPAPHTHESTEQLGFNHKGEYPDSTMNILYCRKSSESEDRQVLSIESQINELTELAQKHGFKIDKVFEESMSAKQPGRPLFTEMVALIKKNSDNRIFTWRLDRLARNPIDGGEIAWDLQQGTIAEIVTPFSCYSPADNVMMMYVEFGMANQYVRELSTNVKRGNKTKLEKGGLPGRTPFGYLNDRANKTVVVDHLRAPYVEKIFRMFATGGYSLKDISKEFYEERLSLNMPKVHASLLYRILTNPFYIGIIVRGDKRYQGSHEPLVSKEFFDECQKVLTGNRSSAYKHLFPLRGFMNCPDCGCMITGTVQKGHMYYHCTNGKHAHVDGREHFRSEVLNEEFAKKLKELQFDEEMIEIMHRAALEENKQDSAFAEAARQNLAQQQKQLTEKRERLEDTYLDGSMAKDRYEARILDLNNEEVILKTQLAQKEKGLNLDGSATIEQTKQAFLTGLFAERDFLNGDDVKKKEFVKTLLSNLTVKEQKIQSIQFKPVFQIMYTTQKNIDISNWCPR